MAKNDCIDITSKRIEQYISAIGMLENIRWRFIASFGLGAFVALFINQSDKKPIIAGILAIVVSIAGLVSQVRIFGLIMDIWARIRILQINEFDSFKKKSDDLSNIKSAFIFPKIEVGKSKYIYTVHMATCFVFASLIGISIYLITEPDKVSSIPILVSTLLVICILMLSFLATSKYLNTLEKGRKTK